MTTHFGKLVQFNLNARHYLRNRHVQTIFPKFVLKAPEIRYVKERIATLDGDFVDLSWAIPTNTESLQGVVVLFHGLEGSDQSHYIKHTIEALHKQYFAAVVMHFRGCSGEPNLSVKAYHSGATFDPEFILPIIKRRYSTLPLFAVGFSLGGNMLMKLMAHHGALPLEAAVCISAPLNLMASSEAINQGFARVYQRHLMKSMKANLLRKMQVVDFGSHLKVTAEQISKMQTFREFDEHITSVLHGFYGADDYYAKCSALPDLHLIQKPSLIIHAIDDPFMNSDVIPNAALINQHVAYEWSEHGGHVGFLESVKGKPSCYLPMRITKFFAELL